MNTCWLGDVILYTQTRTCCLGLTNAQRSKFYVRNNPIYFRIFNNIVN